MKISSKARYGLRACFLLAVADKQMSNAELAQKSSLSVKYLERIMTVLAKSGIVTSSRGLTGGYTLGKSPADISAGEIMRALEDNLEFTDCVSGKCVDAYCPNRMVMSKLYNGINDVLNNYTVSDMINDYKCSPNL